tara:strand:+ start:87 stop:1064 length:978 start_codon:yes stop_codon:yes gene_type:complete
MALALNGTTGISGVDGSASAPSLQGSDSNTGLSFGSDTVNINTGGITRAKLDSSGNFSVPSGKLGVGTESPDYAIEVEGNGGGDTVSLALTNNGSHPAALHLRSGHGNWSIINSATEGDRLEFRNESSNQTNFMLGEGGNGDRFMIHHSDPSTYNANVSCRENSSGPYPFAAIGQSTNQGLMGFFAGNGTLIGSIAKSGNSTQFNTSSDYRLKENDVAITDGITRLKQLRPIRFNWIEFPENGTEDGFFAHEVSPVVPEAVQNDKDGIITQEYIDAGKEVQNSLGKPLIQFLDNSKLIPLLTAALKEAVAKIETLETKVAALEAA